MFFQVFNPIYVRLVGPPSDSNMQINLFGRSLTSCYHCI